MRSVSAAEREAAGGCYVYLIFCEEGSAVYIKVGVSSDPIRRLMSIRHGIPFEPKRFAFCRVSGRKMALKMEALLLAECKKWMSRGEWLQMLRSDAEAFRKILSFVTSHFARGLTLTWGQMDVRAFVEERAKAQKVRLANLQRSRRSRSFSDFERDSKGMTH